MTLSHTLNPNPNNERTASNTTRTLWKAERSGGKVEVRLTLNRYRGRQLLVLREWFWSNGAGEFLPSKRGTTIRPDEASGLLQAFGEALPEISAIPGD